MSNIESIKKNKTSSMDWSVIETLRDLANQIENGEISYNKCFISLLNDVEEGDYYNGYRMARMRSSEAIALIEIMKASLISDM